jgi:hypothetical protein
MGQGKLKGYRNMKLFQVILVACAVFAIWHPATIDPRPDLLNGDSGNQIRDKSPSIGFRTPWHGAGGGVTFSVNVGFFR